MLILQGLTLLKDGIQDFCDDLTINYFVNKVSHDYLSSLIYDDTKQEVKLDVTKIRTCHETRIMTRYESSIRFGYETGKNSLFYCLVTIVIDEGSGTNDGDGIISLFILDGDISCCN